METKCDSYDIYRRESIQSGLEFQDFIMERLHLLGTSLNTYASKKGQYGSGENMLGMEIKHDREMASTGNLYIEYAEKAKPREGPYVPSGICRSDNSWLFGIGDRLLFFIFAISTLRRAYDRRDELGFRKVRKPTSLAFLIPINDPPIHNGHPPPPCARKLCARIIEFDFDGKIKKVTNGADAVAIDLHGIEDPIIQGRFKF